MSAEDETTMAGLEGCRIVVPESRELDLFVSMLERQGAVAIRCPLVTILDLVDPAPVEAWLARLVAGRFDDLVLFTGEGVRRAMRVAEMAGLAPQVREGLGRARKVVRGPKPIKALRDLGLSPEIVAEAPTTEGLIATLSAHDLAGRVVGILGYPGQAGALESFLAAKGAACDRVVPYRYASHEEDARVAATIDAMAAGAVDLIAFTSRPQVGRLRDVAERHGRVAALAEAMARTRIAAVGPVVGRAVEEAGWQVAVAPEDSFHLKPLITTMAALFASRDDGGSRPVPPRGRAPPDLDRGG